VVVVVVVGVELVGVRVKVVGAVVVVVLEVGVVVLLAVLSVLSKHPMKAILSIQTTRQNRAAFYVPHCRHLVAGYANLAIRRTIQSNGL
jgi:hypothetical protein